MRRVMHRFPSKHTEEEEEIQREWRWRGKTGGQGPVGGGGWGFEGACGGLWGAGGGWRGLGRIAYNVCHQCNQWPLSLYTTAKL